MPIKPSELLSEPTILKTVLSAYKNDINKLKQKERIEKSEIQPKEIINTKDDKKTIKELFSPKKLEVSPSYDKNGQIDYIEVKDKKTERILYRLPPKVFAEVLRKIKTENRIDIKI